MNSKIINNKLAQPSFKNKLTQVWVEGKDFFKKSFNQPSFKNKLAQVWVETVIYTLIALILIGTVLAFVKPKIEQLQDKAIVEQSLEIMNSINDNVLSAVQGGGGNKRILQIGLKKGTIDIDGINNKVVFELSGSRQMYSEPDIPVAFGDIEILTEKKGDIYDITLTNNYPEYEILYNGNINGIKTITKSSNPYKIIIMNNGTDPTNHKTQINFEVN